MLINNVNKKVKIVLSVMIINVIVMKYYINNVKKLILKIH